MSDTQPIQARPARDLCFLDTETLGIDLDAPIWEIAAIRRDAVTDEETELYLQVHHRPGGWLARLEVDGPDFADDYLARYRPDLALSPADAAKAVWEFTRGSHIAGVVPSFDTTRLEHQLLTPASLTTPWHYHLIAMENLALGWLHGVAARAIDEARMRGETPDQALVNRNRHAGHSSDGLSRALGIDPDDYRRHTAMGDVRWTMAMYDVITGAPAAAGVVA